MRPAVVYGIVNGDAPVSYWPFFPAPRNNPKSLCEIVEPAQVSSRFQVLKYDRFILFICLSFFRIISLQTFYWKLGWT